MKKIIIAISALVITSASQAKTTHIHNAECKKDCPQILVAPIANPESASSKMFAVKNQAEEKSAQVQFCRSMQATINAANRNKLAEAIKDLEAENAYNNLMAKTMLIIENEKLEDQLDDIEALARYENLMASIFGQTASL